MACPPSTPDCSGLNRKKFIVSHRRKYRGRQFRQVQSTGMRPPQALLIFPFRCPWRLASASCLLPRDPQMAAPAPGLRSRRQIGDKAKGKRAESFLLAKVCLLLPKRNPPQGPSLRHGIGQTGTTWPTLAAREAGKSRDQPSASVAERGDNKGTASSCYIVSLGSWFLVSVIAYLPQPSLSADWLCSSKHKVGIGHPSPGTESGSQLQDH